MQLIKRVIIITMHVVLRHDLPDGVAILNAPKKCPQLPVFCSEGSGSAPRAATVNESNYEIASL